MNAGVGIVKSRPAGAARRGGDRLHNGLASRRNTGEQCAGPLLRVLQATAPPDPAAPDEAGQVVVPRIGLQLARQLPFDSWLRIGRQLSAVVNASSWCLGDWLAYGEVAYSGRYRDAVELTCLDYQTLRNYAWVAKRFPLSRRRDNLSFGHHAEVAALPEPEQDFWLRKAEEFGWSRNRLRRELRASLREQRAEWPGSDQEQCEEPDHGKPPGAGSDDDAPAGLDGSDTGAAGAHRLELNLTSAQLTLCREAAGREGLRVDDWALQVLSNAAKDIVLTSASAP